MTLEEAKIIGEVIATADGGCESCASDLAEELNQKFPEFVWRLVEDSDGNCIWPITVEVIERPTETLGEKLA